MLRISKLTDYGTVVMTELARDPKQVVSAAVLADRLQLQGPTLSKILKRLAKAGLVTSFRGAEGGYCLGGIPEEISVAAVIDALEGPISLTECTTDDHSCSQESQCGVRDHWQVINGAVRQALESVTLAQMTRSVATQALAGSAPSAHPLAAQGATQKMVEIPLTGGRLFSPAAMSTLASNTSASSESGATRPTRSAI